MLRRYISVLFLFSGLIVSGVLVAHAQTAPSFPPYFNTHACYIYATGVSLPQPAPAGTTLCYSNNGSYVQGGAVGTSGLGSAIAEAGAVLNGTPAYSQQVTTAIDSASSPLNPDNPLVTSQSGSVTVGAGQPVKLSWAFQDYMAVHWVTNNACGFLGMFTCTNDNAGTVQLYGTPTANFNLPACSGGGRSSSACNLSGTVTVNPTQNTTYTITAPVTLSEPTPTCGHAQNTITFTPSNTKQTLLTNRAPIATCTWPSSDGDFAAHFSTVFMGTTTQGLGQWQMTYLSNNFGGNRTVNTTLSIPVVVKNFDCSAASGGGASGTYPSCTCNQSGYSYNANTNACTAPPPPPLCSAASGGGATGTFPNCTCNTSGYVYNSSTNACTASTVYNLTGPAAVTSGTAPTLTYTIPASNVNAYVCNPVYCTHVAFGGPTVGQITEPTQTTPQSFQIYALDPSSNTWKFVGPVVTVGIIAAPVTQVNFNYNPNPAVVGQPLHIKFSATETQSCSLAGVDPNGKSLISGASYNGTDCAVDPLVDTPALKSPGVAVFTLNYVDMSGNPGSRIFNVPVGAAPGIISNFTATPSRVLSGGTSYLTWSTSDMASCSLVKASDHSSVSAPLKSSGHETPITVTRAEIYTLSCVGIDGNTYTSTANLKITPSVIEL